MLHVRGGPEPFQAALVGRVLSAFVHDDGDVTDGILFPGRRVRVFGGVAGITRIGHHAFAAGDDLQIQPVPVRVARVGMSVLEHRRRLVLRPAASQDHESHAAEVIARLRPFRQIARGVFQFGSRQRRFEQVVVAPEPAFFRLRPRSAARARIRATRSHGRTAEATKYPAWDRLPPRPYPRWPASCRPSTPAGATSLPRERTCSPGSRRLSRRFRTRSVSSIYRVQHPAEYPMATSNETPSRNRKLSSA